jgi:uncharacterized repeat protein (TIGR01451 family)
MRRPAVHLFIVLVSIAAILASARLFATADGPLRIYLPSIFKQADGSMSDQPGDDDTSTGDDVYAGTDFEIEGNLVVNGVAGSDIDWESPDVPADARVEDPHSKRETDFTIFKPDGKFDKPESWIIQDGKVGPGQNELTNIMAWLIEGEGEDDDDWVVMGMERTKKEGTFFLDFEFNQSGWDPDKGVLRRKPGDVVVGFELKGNPTDREKDLSVLIVQYLDKQPSKCEVTPGVGNRPAEVKVGTDPCPAYGEGGFYYRFLADGAIVADSGLGEATMNAERLPVPDGWKSYDSQGGPRDVIPPFQFAEAAINLGKLDIELDCAKFSSVHAKDRSSLEPNADLKDLAGPIPTQINCLINGYKFHDLDADGVWDRDAEVGLEGWDIHLDTDLTDTITIQTGADGFYEFEWLESGTYTVSEECPTDRDWLQTSPDLTDFEGCGTETYTVEINMEDREQTDKSFGNIDPGLVVEKQCEPDVSLGEPIPYTITVTNTGSPILTNISVDDTLLGDLDPIATLEPDASEILTDTYIAREVGPITNTVTVSKTFSSVTLAKSVTISDTDTCVTVVHEPKAFNVFLAFEDKPNQEELPPGISPNDYDYNDFVMNVEYEPAFLENENMSQIVFTMTQVADSSSASHTFIISPEFTPGGAKDEGYKGCDGTFTRTGGGFKDAAGDFVDGKTITTTVDTNDSDDPAAPAIVAIEFTATPDGCDFDIASANSMIRENIHCEDCFFNPTLESTKTDDNGKPVWVWTTTITKFDVRMLSIPDPVYNWPAEHPAGCSSVEECHVHIWECYPEVDEITQGDKHPTPEFKPDWWETWVDYKPIRCPRRP